MYPFITICLFWKKNFIEYQCFIDYEKNLDNVDCSGVKDPRPEENIACKFNYSALTEHCNEANRYGMADGKPCILLKLNKVCSFILFSIFVT